MFVSKLLSIVLIQVQLRLSFTRTLHPALPSLSESLAQQSCASPALLAFFKTYFQAKSTHNAPALLSHFDPEEVVYCDAVLGTCYDTPAQLDKAFTQLLPSWPPNAVSIPLEVLGDTNSSVIRFVDTAAEFGAEIRAMSAIDLRHGKIVRQIDYWNGRHSSVTADRVSPSSYPYSLRIGTVKSSTASDLSGMVQQLNTAFQANDSKAAAALFTYNAVFEDLTLSVRQDGRNAIQGYLGRVLDTAPYGVGSSIRHVLGDLRGGGYEWLASADSHVRNGITALEVDDGNHITQLQTVWDASFLTEAELDRLVQLTVKS